jgi:effector-binding domain-containing protein
MVPVARRLFEEAVRLDLHVTGPVHWHYFGFTGDPLVSFALEVALPVAEIPLDYDGDLHLKRTEAFECVSVVHEGSWAEMTSTYERIMGFIKENKLTMTGVTREIYINADFRNPEANTTEIQVGVRQ